MTVGAVDEADWAPLPVAPSVLGESPFWHPDEAALYWCDIPGRALNRWHPASGDHQRWDFECEPCSAAPLPGGTLLLAMREGLFRFHPATGERKRLAPPPYDAKSERFNDGKADPQGRFWVGTIHDQRLPEAALYRFAEGKLDRMLPEATSSNGLAFSPDGRTMYWADTKPHRIWAFDFDGSEGTLSRRRLFAEFPQRAPEQDIDAYGGRPDGAAMDAEGCYWVAMFEGRRLLRFAPDGTVLRELKLPVRCPTMPCFGGPDLRTLFVTTSREKRSADELARFPSSGSVLSLRVDVPGLPVNFARL